MEAKSAYIFKNFSAVFKITLNQFQISYGLDGTSKIQIRKGDASLFGSKKQVDVSKIAFKVWRGLKVPFLFDSFENDAEIITLENDRVYINFDIIASSFYFLSNWQEYTCEKNDKYGRFPYNQSIQYKLNIIDKPVVNYYFDILKTAIEMAYKVELKNTLWGNSNFSTCITHDIDNCESAWLQGSYRELIKGNVLSPLKLVSKKIFGEDDWFNFDKIIEIEKKYNAHSSFYFLPVRGKIDGIVNADYTIDDSKFKGVFELISENGSEVGIHGSVGSHANIDTLKTNLKRLNRETLGGRFHFLLYDAFKTPEILSLAKQRYDTSLGFAEQYGFRNGFCLPFYLYDIKNDKATDVIEIPLTLMDCTLSRYMEVNKEEALGRVIDIVSEIEKFQGCFTLLWHNTYFSDYKYKGWREVFEKILQHCQQRNSLLTSGETIVKYFCSSAN